jgi:N6-L-threonylcarbamoyladenine synthase
VKTQIGEHARFGGVVPEVASRLHLNYLSVAVEEALAQAGKDLADIDLIAVANRPGLSGGLLVGTTLAKTFSMLLGKPMVCVDHLMGHLLAPDLVEPLCFPCIGGVFSGGHCNIYYGESRTQWQMICRSRDDAPGESFDKVAKLMGLGYPGGPALQAFATTGSPKAYPLPKPLPKSLAGDFSFSGLKTAVLYHLKGTNGKSAVPKTQWPDLAASFERVVAETMAKRCVDCAEEKGAEHIYIGGGVAANLRLRQALEQDCRRVRSLKCVFPPLALCMDNAAMIASAGFALYESGVHHDLLEDVCSRSELGLS